jgi:hypothetical protein
LVFSSFLFVIATYDTAVLVRKSQGHAGKMRKQTRSIDETNGYHEITKWAKRKPSQKWRPKKKNQIFHLLGGGTATTEITLTTHFFSPHLLHISPSSDPT